MADAEKAGKPGRRPRQIDRESNAYFGVVAMWRDGRLIVNASRKSYAIQYRGDDGKWITAERASHASLLAHSLIYWPELQAAALRLPEFPTEAVTALRQGTLPLTKGQIMASLKWRAGGG